VECLPNEMQRIFHLGEAYSSGVSEKQKKQKRCERCLPIAPRDGTGVPRMTPAKAEGMGGETIAP
jgi:hypothetical protein